MSRLAKLFVLFVSLIGLGATNANAAACTAIASTAWNVQTTWGALGTGCAGAPGGIPGAADTVTVPTTFTVTVTAAAAATSLTVNGTGSVVNNSTLTVSGALGGTGGLTNSATGILNIGGNSTITTLTATFAGNTVNYTGAAQTAKVTTYSNLTLSGSGAKTFATTPTVTGVLSLEGTATVVVTTGVVTYGAGATLQYKTTNARSATLEEWPATFSASGGVIVANTAGSISLTAAKVFSASVPLTINSGATLATGNSQITFGGNFVNNGGTFTAGSSPIVITGAVAQSIAGFTTTGAISVTKTGGTATITGNINAASLAYTTAAMNGGSVSLDPGVAVVLTGAFSMARPAVAATSGSIFAVNAGSLSCTTLTLGGTTGAVRTTTLSVSTGTVTASGLITAGGVASIVTFTGAGTISTAGTGTTTLGTFTAGTGTVNYTGAAQTVANVAYYNLGFSGSAAKTMGATTVNGDFTMSGTATTAPTGALTVGGNFSIGAGNTFANGTNALNVAGNFDQSGTFTAGAGVVTLNGGVAVQTISGAGTLGFANLTINNTGGIYLQRDVTVTIAIIGAHTLTSTCPTDWTLTSNGGATVEHSCPPPPTVTTNAATALTTSGATLNGTVSSNGASTTVTFDYGLTASYGSSATAAQSPLAAGAVNTAVSAAVTGLTCNTLYHFRATGVNSAGTTNGGDLTFTTSACPAVVINTYYPGTDASVPVGSTSITLGAATGVATPIAIGDTLLIIQMQDASINNTNTDAYGDGLGGDLVGQGTTGTGGSGLYEYVVAGSNVSTAGGTLTLSCGTTNAYTNAAATASAGQKKYQVIRVPVYPSYTLNALTALAWNGSTGGVLAFDVTGALTLNSATVSVDGMGFRGGAGRGSTSGSGLNTDYWTLATNLANGSKGEGIAGTPRYVFTAPSTSTDNGADVYLNGSFARGAPANAGGGATDINPAANDENPGGGGGANGGAGGMGGIGWCPGWTIVNGIPPYYFCGLAGQASATNPAGSTGGFGGAAVAGLGATRLTLGGGGGAGTSNNSTGTLGALSSSGAAGGGVIMLRAGSLTGTATFNANGSAGDNTVCNDGSGGGGAGGAVLINAGSGMGGVTINVKGGKGGDTLVPPCAGQTPHGPGGGGGGGYAITSAASASCSSIAGLNGVTYNGGVLFGAYGSTSGSAGSCATSLTAAQIPGTRLGATSCIDHYELSVPASSITCLPTTVTVTACKDSANPCTPVATIAAGSATLATVSVPASSPTIGAVTFPPSVATTTLSDPLAVDGTKVTVTLTSASPAAQNAATCNSGGDCSVVPGASTTFNTAGFIFSSSMGGGIATIPTQVAGTSSGTYYLRAVKTGTTTQDCVAALTGANTVSFAYECNNPTACYTSNLMSVNGSVAGDGGWGTATTIARNNNGSVSSYLPVNMTFDANGNAPFTFNYSDVGQVTLWANKTVNSAVLTGSTNPFVVKPAGFVLTTIQQTAPVKANPASANASDVNFFVKAGTNFSATVTAVTSTGSTAYNYGKENSPEGVKLTNALVTGLGLTNNPTLANPTAFGAFSNGVATGTTFSWDEVGIITLTPSVGDTSYLGVGDVTGTTTGNVGRFIPDHFAITSLSIAAACSTGTAFTYFGQDGFTTTFMLTAQGVAPGNATTTNYTGAGIASTWAKLPLTTWGAAPASAGSPGFGFAASAWAPSQPAGSSLAASLTAPTATNSNTWSAGTTTVTARHQIVRPTAAAAPTTVTVTTLPVDSDGVTATSATAIGSPLLRFGRLKLSNAHGSELLNLPVPIQTQYWNNTAFVPNVDDNCTVLNSANIALGNYQRKTGDTWTTSPTLVNTVADQGAWQVNLSRPTATFTGKGSVDLCVDLGADPVGGTVCSATSASLPYLQGLWSPGTSYNNDPGARATFGVYRGNNQFIYLRENY